MEGQPEFVQMAWEYGRQGWDIARGWLLSPAAWSQFALLLIAILVALPANRRRVGSRAAEDRQHLSFR